MAIICNRTRSLADSELHSILLLLFSIKIEPSVVSRDIANYTLCSTYVHTMNSDIECMLDTYEVRNKIDISA